MAGLFAYIGFIVVCVRGRFGLPPAIYSLVLAGIALGMVIRGQINVLLFSTKNGEPGKRPSSATDLTVYLEC